MTRVVVTGATGLLGSTLAPILAEHGYQVIKVARSAGGDVRVDLTEADATYRALDAAQPDVIVNLAAATDLDECERNPAFAYSLNTRTVENIVRWMASGGGTCHLVQISTDQVYGTAGPHKEGAVCLINYYAFSKYAAELVASQVRSTVLRTNLFGRSRRPDRASISDWVVSALRRREAIKVFDDVLFSPLSLETLSQMIALAVGRGLPGLYNLGSKEGMTKADFAFKLAQCLGLPADTLIRASSAEVQLVARRPNDMRMDCGRFESSFGITLPTLEKEINLMRDAYASQA